MRVLYFSHLKSVTGQAEESFDLDGPIDQPAFWKLLISRHPKLTGYRDSVRLARNEQYVSDSDFFTQEDEVALIPPVSGG